MCERQPPSPCSPNSPHQFPSPPRAAPNRPFRRSRPCPNPPSPSQPGPSRPYPSPSSPCRPGPSRQSPSQRYDYNGQEELPCTPEGQSPGMIQDISMPEFYVSPPSLDVHSIPGVLRPGELFSPQSELMMRCFAMNRAQLKLRPDLYPREELYPPPPYNFNNPTPHSVQNICIPELVGDDDVIWPLPEPTDDLLDNIHIPCQPFDRSITDQPLLPKQRYSMGLTPKKALQSRRSSCPPGIDLEKPPPAPLPVPDLMEGICSDLAGSSIDFTSMVPSPERRAPVRRLSQGLTPLRMRPAPPRRASGPPGFSLEKQMNFPQRIPQRRHSYGGRALRQLNNLEETRRSCPPNLNYVQQAIELPENEECSEHEENYESAEQNRAGGERVLVNGPQNRPWQIAITFGVPPRSPEQSNEEEIADLTGLRDDILSNVATRGSRGRFRKDLRLLSEDERQSMYPPLTEPEDIELCDPLGLSPIQEKPEPRKRLPQIFPSTRLSGVSQATGIAQGGVRRSKGSPAVAPRSSGYGAPSRSSQTTRLASTAGSLRSSSICSPSAVPPITSKPPMGLRRATGTCPPSGALRATGMASPSGVSRTSGVCQPSVASRATGMASTSGVPRTSAICSPSGAPRATGMTLPSAVPRTSAICTPSGALRATGMALPSAVPRTSAICSPSGAPRATGMALPSAVPRTSAICTPSGAPRATGMALPSAVPRTSAICTPSGTPRATGMALPSAVPRTSAICSPSGVTRTPESAARSRPPGQKPSGMLAPSGLLRPSAPPSDMTPYICPVSQPPSSLPQGSQISGIRGPGSSGLPKSSGPQSGMRKPSGLRPTSRIGLPTSSITQSTICRTPGTRLAIPQSSGRLSSGGQSGSRLVVPSSSQATIGQASITTVTISTSATTVNSGAAVRSLRTPGSTIPTVRRIPGPSSSQTSCRPRK